MFPDEGELLSGHKLSIAFILNSMGTAGANQVRPCAKRAEIISSGECRSVAAPPQLILKGHHRRWARRPPRYAALTAPRDVPLWNPAASACVFWQRRQILATLVSVTLADMVPVCDNSNRQCRQPTVSAFLEYVRPGPMTRRPRR